MYAKTYICGGYTAYVCDGYIIRIWESKPDPIMMAFPGREEDGALAEGYKGDTKAILSLMLLRAADILSEQNLHISDFEGGLQTTEDKNGYRYYYYGIWASDRRNGDKLHCIEYNYYKEKLN